MTNERSEVRFVWYDPNQKESPYIGLDWRGIDYATDTGTFRSYDNYLQHYNDFEWAELYPNKESALKWRDSLSETDTSEWLLLEKTTNISTRVVPHEG